MMNNILFTYDLFLSSSGFFVQGLIPLDIENTPSVKDGCHLFLSNAR